MDFGISERRLGLHRGFHSRFSGILAMVPPRPASSRQRQKVKTLMDPPPSKRCVHLNGHFSSTFAATRP